MAIDPSIIMSGRAPQLMSPVEAAQGAMTMNQLAMVGKQRAEEQAIQDAYKRNMQQGGNGVPVLNRQAFMSEVAKINPMKMQEMQAAHSKKSQEDLKNQIEMQHQLAWSMNDENSYQTARQKAL